MTRHELAITVKQQIGEKLTTRKIEKILLAAENIIKAQLLEGNKTITLLGFGRFYTTVGKAYKKVSGLHGKRVETDVPAKQRIRFKASKVTTKVLTDEEYSALARE